MICGWSRAACLACLWLCSAQALTCIQQDDPRNPLGKVQVNCSPSSKALLRLESKAGARVASTDVINSNLTFQGLKSPVNSILLEASSPSPVQNVNYTNMFKFDLNCPSSVSLELCHKANVTIYHAGQLISNTLLLTSTINVNVTLSSFCDSQQVCTGASEIVSLAAAAPARTVPLIDDDGATRLYPQAVVKQFSSLLNGVPQFSDYDVNLSINSETSFYYPGIDSQIGQSQIDFLFVVLHELMHGIGFTSSYEDYFHDTSAITITPNVLLTYSTGQVVFEGFIESAFDRSLMFSNSAIVTDLVKTINRDLLSATQNTTFNDTDQLTSFVLDVPGFEQISRTFSSNFTTANTTFFVSEAKNTSTVLQLETSITPYSSGSSISHFAGETYLGTGDFLMRASLTKGVSLAQSISNAKHGGAMDTDIYGAIGPGLRAILSSLGYRVRGGVPTQSQVLTASSIKTGPDVTSATIKASKSYGLITAVVLLCVWQITN